MCSALLWEMHPFEHLDTNFGSHGTRLSKVYSKLLVWQLPVALELKVVILMDSDIMVNKNVDELFHLVQRCEIAAIMRCENEKSLVKGRLSHTISQSRSQVRGGINSGIVVLKPCNTVFENMMRYMKTVFEPRPQ